MNEYLIKIILLFALGVLALIDYKKLEIPVFLTVIFSVFFTTVFVAENLIQTLECRFGVPEFIGGIAVGAVLLLIAYLTGEGIGMGDAYVFMMTGSALGIYNNMGLLLLSSIVAAVVGLIVIVAQKYRRNRYPALPGPVDESLAAGAANISLKQVRMPFVPCIFCAYIIMLMI